MSYIIPEQNFAGVHIPEIEYTVLMGGCIAAGWPPSGTAAMIAGRVAIFIDTYNYKFVAADSADALVSYAGQTSMFGSSWTYDGKTVFYVSSFNSREVYNGSGVIISGTIPVNTFAFPQAQVAWLMVYGGYTGFSVTYDLQNCTGSETNPTLIAPTATVTTANFASNDTFEFVSASCWIDGEGYPEGTPVVFAWEPETGALRIGPVTSDITIHVRAYGDPYAEIDGESEIPGGSSIVIPGLPGITATSAGVLGLFAPSASQMQLLADFMWTDFGGSGTTEVDVLKEIVEALKRAISNPLDYVTGLNIIPSQGLSIGAAQEIRFGFVNSGVSMPRITNQYFTVDCGSLSFDTLCVTRFLTMPHIVSFPYICLISVLKTWTQMILSVIQSGSSITVMLLRAA